jgi:hypothetical protein
MITNASSALCNNFECLVYLTSKYSEIQNIEYLTRPICLFVLYWQSHKYDNVLVII